MRINNLLLVVILSTFTSLSFAQNTRYWVGDGGTWNDANNWSATSGGAGGATVPGDTTNVFFDANSFSAGGFEVFVDTVGFFASMNWTGSTGNQTLRLDSSLVSYGDVTFASNVTVVRDTIAAGIRFKGQSYLTANNSTIDCSFIMLMDVDTDSLLLVDDVVMSDTSSFIFVNGEFYTQNNNIVTGSMFCIDKAGATDSRTIVLGTSFIHLKQSWDSSADGALTFDSGTSNIYIGDTVQYFPDTVSYYNNLKTQNLTFYDVTLNFQALVGPQKLEGDNSFNKLRVVAGSRIEIQSGSNQSIIDSLILQGSCKDSIQLYSSTSGNNITLTKSGTDVIAECLQMEDITISSAQTAYYSDSIANNSGWTFDTSIPVTANFSAVGPFCFGDTTEFTNSSTTATGSLTYLWNYNDGSYNAFQNDSIQANQSDTIIFNQPAGADTSMFQQLVSWTETLDPSSLFDDVTGGTNTVTGAEKIKFDFTVDYNLLLDNTSGSTAFLVDMDSLPQTAVNKYRTKIKLYKNGIAMPSASPNSAFTQWNFYEDTIANGIDTLGSQVTSFSIITPNIAPTDIITIYAGVEITYSSDSLKPRWKSTNSTIGADVTVDTKLDINSIYMTATPITSFYQDTLFHAFQNQADSIPVVLIALNPANQCSDTLVQPVSISSPSALLTATDVDGIICEATPVTFYGSSTSAGAIYEFSINDTIVQAASTDTSYATMTLSDGDSIALTVFAGGCASVDTVDMIFTVNPLPVFSWSSSDPDTTICSTDLVSFDASPDTTYTYQYLLNQSSASPYTNTGIYSNSTLADGDTVSVVAKSSMNCKDTMEMIFTVNPLPTTTLSESSGGNVICQGDAVTFTASGANTYSFFVDGVLQQGPSTTTTWTTTALASGEVVSVTGYSIDGCPLDAPTTYSYSVNPLPVTTLASSATNDTICAGQSVSFSGTGAGSYEFFLNGVSVQGPSGTSVYSNGSLTDGDTVFVIGNISGCTQGSDSIITTVNVNPTTSLASTYPNDTICSGNAVTFTASGATNYTFFLDGMAQQGPSATNTWSTSSLTNGQTISVIGESNNCEVTDQTVFTVLTNPTVSIFSNDPDNTICDGGAITFTGANAATYELFVNGSSVAGPQASAIFNSPALSVGSNAVEIFGVAANGCPDTSNVINVTVNPIPTISISSSDPDSTICAGESVTFTGTGGDSYQFYVNGTPQGSMSPTSTFTTTSLTNGAVISVNGLLQECPNSSGAITMTVNSIPTITLSSTDVDNIYCDGDTVTYTAGGATNYEFFVDGVSQGPSSPTNTINSIGFAIGTYNVTVQGESNNCTASTTNTVTVNGLPTAGITTSAPSNTACSGQPVNFTATGGNVYEFFVNTTSQGSPSPISTFSTSTLNNGDVVSVIATSPQGCQNTASVGTMIVNPTPTVTVSSSVPSLQLCIGDNVDITASGATDYEFFVNGVSQGPPSTNNIFSTNSLANGDAVTVTGTSMGCSDSPAALNFVVYGPPVVSLTSIGDTAVCVGENTDLVASGANNFQFLVNGTPTGPFSASPNFNSPLNNGDVVTALGETNGCTSPSNESYTFTVYNFPTLTSSSTAPTNTICINDSVGFTASGAMTYDFDLNGTVLQSGPGATFGISTLTNGDVISITGYNGDCPSAPDSYTFTVNSMTLTLDVSPSSMICAGETATFTAGGADQYEFFLNGVSTGPMGTGNTYVNSALTDEDEVTFTGYSSSTLCTQEYSDYIIMNVIDEPLATPLSATDFCEGDSVVLVSNAGYGNQWYVDGNPISGAIDTFYVAYTSGTYSLETTGGGNGDMWSFGLNADGTFANGNNLNNADPTPAVSGVQFDELTSGYSFMVGVATNGDLYSWGDNSSGQLGNGTYTASNTPLQVPTLTNVKTAATTQNSSMAVLSSGDVYVWGNNSQGQLGTGNTSVINFPFLNASLSNTDSIAGGKNHFVILKNDGTVWTVGDNSYGQLGQGNLTGSMTPVQVAGLSNVVSVGAGEYHSFAIDNNGDLYVWGNNGSGQLGLNDLTNRLVPDLSSLKNIINAQGGANHSAFLSSDGKIYTSGGNSFGQLGTGNYTSNLVPVQVAVSGAKMISTGQYTTLVKRSDKTVFGFGNNTEEQLSSLSGTTVPTPEYINDLDGVGFIEAGQSASHVLFSEAHSCVSQDVVVSSLPVPAVTINVNVDTLSTVAGVSYQWYFEGLTIPGATSQTYVANNSGNYSVEVTFANGCVGTSATIYHSMTGIDELDLSDIYLYPNPAEYQLNIVIPAMSGETVELDIYDQAGRLVYSIDTFDGQTFKLNIEELEAGVYNLVVRNEQSINTLRFIRSGRE